MGNSGNFNIDLTPDILRLIEPLVAKPDVLVIKRLDTEEDIDKREQHYLILCDKDDVGKVVGRHGIISDALRTIFNVSNKYAQKHIHLRFDSLDSDIAKEVLGNNEK